MLQFSLYFSAVIVMIISIGMLKSMIKPRFIKIALLFNLLFFGVFLYLLFHTTNLSLNDLRQIPDLLSPEQKLKSEQVIADSVKVTNVSITEDVLLDVPLINQLPELPRGCEVTSLAMLLSDAGINVDKMTLAKEVEKDPTPYQIKDGNIYFGNPHEGFVGDMYNINNPGLGVYHQPIMKLAEKYLPNQVVNLTGKGFEDLQLYLSHDSPIWVIINTTYKELPPNQFQTWETPTGTVEITYKEHSVLITGYNEEYIFFNDPLTGTKNKKAPKEDFIKAWEQMGSQAITYVSKVESQ